MKNKNIKKIILLNSLTFLLILSSCQIATTKYSAPEINSENLFREENSSDTTTIANITWKEYFKDPILRDLIEEGLQNNYDMQIAAARIKQVEASLGIAKAAYFPDRKSTRLNSSH